MVVRAVKVSKAKTGKKSKKRSTVARFELARSKSNGLAIHRLNHSATLSSVDDTGQYYYNVTQIDTEFHMI